MPGPLLYVLYISDCSTLIHIIYMHLCIITLRHEDKTAEQSNAADKDMLAKQSGWKQRSLLIG